MLAHDVRCAAMAPEVGEVPLVGVPRHGVERRVDAVGLDGSAGVAVTGDHSLRRLRAAERHSRAGPAVEIHVHLAAAGLLVDEADEEAAVAIDSPQAVPLATD